MPAISQLSFTVWLGLILSAGPALAQSLPANPEARSVDDPAAIEVADEAGDAVPEAATDDLITQLVFESAPPADAWVEVASLIADVPAFVAVFRGDAADAVVVPEPLDPSLPQGPAMVCSGVRPALSPTRPNESPSEAEAPAEDDQGESAATTPPVDAGIFCQRVFLYRGEASFGPPGDDDLAITLDYADRDETAGTPATGRYRLGVEPIDGARVALVPLDLRAEQGFVMPLGLSADGAGLTHSVTTDAEGQFRLPPVQAGRYRLEARLPSGRIHRSDAIDLPDLTTLRNDIGPDPPPDLAFDLGSIDVAEGLGLEVLAVDDLGLPVEAARVVARQGETPATLATYASRTDADGRAELSGFDVERPVLLGCSAPGHVPERAEHELIPVSWTCTLARLARVRGVVVG
ncbi:MAG: carboxypeptidase-like regulatory domain-containing protein, partial [Acidobacteriota bacterium]